VSDAAPSVQAVLNGAQAAAAQHLQGPLVVFAGAGSGKTRVITYRIANLLAGAGVPPYKILAVTFTNKAAGEMKRRLETLVGEDLARDLWVGTFHAVCARLLRRHHDAAGLGRAFVIYDDIDQRAVLARVYKELRIDERRFPVRQVLGRIHREKQEARGPDEYESRDFVGDVVARCYPAYQAQLTSANAVDFDDLLLKVLRLAEDARSAAGEDLRHRFAHVLVDEFQDVNQVQYRLVRAMTARSKNLCVVGDDDQSIYRWRGADVRILRSFKADFPGARVVKLEQNYRSTANIVRAALGVIEKAEDREPKELWTQNAPGAKVLVMATGTERDEAAWVVGRVREILAAGISPSEIAVFYRVHAQSRVLEEVMRADRIPHQVIGGVRFFERAEIKDLLSYLRVLENPASDVDLARILNVPPRKIGASTVDKLVAYASEAKTTLWGALVPCAEDGRLGAQARKAVLAFSSLMSELAAAAKSGSPSEVATLVLERTGYQKMLQDDDAIESESRLLNLGELVGAIREYEEEAAAQGEAASLSGYLERVTLSAAADDLKDAPKVALMTVHAAKGLEFSHVFLSGMEEDMFPFRSMDPRGEGDLEEERRLAYVAITRARERLYVTHAERRTIFGSPRYCAPSRFLADIPPDVTEHATTETMRSGFGKFLDRESWAAPQPRLAWSHPQKSAQAAPAPPRAPGERYVERDDERPSGLGPRRSPPVDVAIGTRVAHRSFGFGRVVGVDDGPDPTATVDFVGWGTKRVKIRFLDAG
jgi:DNA helicase-2/ATP-dependent DNA helicase PcrA